MLTPDLPGVGGRIRAQLDDFEVDEIPSYEPSGQGDHLYLWIEKRGVGPEYLTRILAQRLGVPVGAIGLAGLKDRHAVTRQWVSVPGEAESRLGAVDGDGLQVLRVARHTNKLKTGHLRGNRFRILIREADATRSVSVDQILTRLRDQGLPNYYGPQRFGRDGSTVELGFQCLARTQPRRLRPFLFRFALSAVQSLLFNDYLGRRLSDGLFRTVLGGDVLMKWPLGGLFVAVDPEVEQPRFDSREVVTGGPMFGGRMFETQGPAHEREDAILQAHRLPRSVFAGFGKLMGGTRRHNQVYLDDLTATWEPTGLRLQFTLPAGSYATVLLREIMKSTSEPEDEASDSEED